MKSFGTFALLLLSLCAVTPTLGQGPGVATSFRFFDALDTAAVPKRLSESGLFKDIQKKEVGPGIHRYELNTPLWSDGAEKIRYLILPPDSQISFHADSAYGFPKGTVFVKNFLFDSLPGDTASRFYLETRLLVKQHAEGSAESQWYGFSYRWSRDGSDAFLVDGETGMDTSFPVRRADGTGEVRKTWTFPSQNACWRCHIPKGRQVLGFFTAQINRPDPVQDARNQLETLAARGLFKNAMALQGAHRWAPLSDTSLPLERRARSYLAANCSFCHGADGFRTLGAFLSAQHNFDFFKPDFPINYLNKPAKFDYGIPGALLIYGGDPDKSILTHRMRDRSPRVQMPPLATAEPDTLALRVISQWIATLDPPAASVKYGQRTDRLRPEIRGRILEMPLSLLKEGERSVRLWTLQGRPLALRGHGTCQFLILGDPAPGLYFLATGAGKETFLVIAP